MQHSRVFKWKNSSQTLVSPVTMLGLGNECIYTSLACDEICLGRICALLYSSHNNFLKQHVILNTHL